MSLVAVIDVETTGLSPRRSDRVVEIAAVVIDADGEIVREFVTLVNPGRHVGPSWIHGIEANDVRHAPRFEEVAGLLLETLDGCVGIAGHNLGFDRSFLLSEFSRAQHSFPDCPTFCTMRLSGGGRLAVCCARHGVVFQGKAHSALGDARATACLLAKLYKTLPMVVERIRALPAIAWPAVEVIGPGLLTREEARGRATMSAVQGSLY